LKNRDAAVRPKSLVKFKYYAFLEANMKNVRNIIVIFGSAIPSVRTSKLIKTFEKWGFEVTCWVWSRYKTNIKKLHHMDAKYRVLMIGGGEANRWLIFYYPLWMLIVFVNLLFNKPSLVYAANFDSALPCAIASLFYPLSFIYDNQDTFYLRYSFPFILVRILVFFERIILARARLVLVPDANRITSVEEPFRSKIVIIYNCPEDMSIRANQSQSNNLRVFLSGYLTRDRGVHLLLTAAEQLTDIEIIVAGYSPDKELLEEIIRHPKVRFYGYVSQQDALALCHQCDVVFSFYEPSTEIYLRAASNKWFDAMMASKPILTNQEIINANWIKENDIGYVCPYGSVPALVETLRYIATHREEAIRKGKNGRKLFEAEYNWPNMEKRLRQAFTRVGLFGS
jgi:glycosyltransferase involved in cell wall biosynthesis